MVILLIAGSSHHLTVRDADDRMQIAFGSLPPFRRRVYYAGSLNIEQDRTTWIEDCGIHVSPRGGWVWNRWATIAYSCIGHRCRILPDCRPFCRLI